MDAEKLARYEDAIRELESRQADLQKNRGGYMKLFVGLVVVSFVGFFWNRWAGVGTLVTGVLMWVFGVYVVRIRAGDYELELAELRQTAAELREAQGNAPMPDVTSLEE
jgi:hypothetical protein